MRKIKFQEKETLDHKLAEEIILRIEELKAEKDSASILFSGGSTPKGLFQKLANSALDWTNVKIGLVDDRMVDENSPYSNARMLNELLIENIQKGFPEFYPLVFDYKIPDINILQAQNSILQIDYPDIAILGMGTDGHFASLFPQDKNSVIGLSENHAFPLIYTSAPSEPKQRISCSWSYIRNAKNIILHINGDKKLEIIESSEKRKKEERLPIDVLLSDCEISPTMYWAP